MYKYLLAAAMLCMSLCVNADPSASNGRDTIVFHNAPCPVSISSLVQAPLEIRAQFMAAEAFVDGKHFDACYLATPRGVYVIFEDGDEAIVPINMIKEGGV